ncbi:hypothetical protein AZOA_33110 [Azoarcus sp. Aa7]|nr:hypothetical protein [Azoarcus sp. Aa7]
MPASSPRSGRLPAHEALDLGELLGSEWDGFSLSRDGLQHPYWRRPFSCGELKAMFYRSQQVAILEREVSRARTEQERASAAQDAAEARADWYRHQLTLESRLGLMLARVSA